MDDRDIKEALSPYATNKNIYMMANKASDQISNTHKHYYSYFGLKYFHTKILLTAQRMRRRNQTN